MNEETTDQPNGNEEEKTARYAEMGDLLESSVADEKAGSELRKAWTGFVESTRDLGGALAGTAGDPEVRAKIMGAVRSLVENVGNIAKETAENVGNIAKETAETAAEKVRTVTDRSKSGAEGAADQTEPASEDAETAAGDGEEDKEKAESSDSE